MVAWSIWSEFSGVFVVVEKLKDMSDRRLNMAAFSTPISIGLRDCPIKPAEGQRVLGSFIIPDFQRQEVWTLAQKVRLIESVWMGLPIGSYVVNETNDWTSSSKNANLWLIDGQQRWAALIGYVKDEFPVDGRLFSELSRRDHRCFDDVVFPCYRTRFEDVATLRDLYERLAYGGTAHEPSETNEMAP